MMAAADFSLLIAPDVGAFCRITVHDDTGNYTIIIWFIAVFIYNTEVTLSPAEPIWTVDNLKVFAIGRPL